MLPENPDPRQASPHCASPLDALDHSLQLAFPPALAQLTQALLDPMPEFSVIARYLALDPALATAVLNVANSPSYGFSLKITDLQRAAIALGTREMFKLVIALAVHKRIHGLTRRKPEAQFADWRITLWGAIAAEEIASALAPQKTAEAYLGTLLKDLPLLLALCRDDAPDWLAGAPAVTLPLEGQAEKERRLWGAEHAALTGRMLERWNLPPELIRAIQAHHATDEIPNQDPLARCICLATRWAELLHGNMSDIAPLAAFEVTLAAALSLPAPEMEGLRQRCTMLFKTLLSQLGIQEGPAHTRFYEHTLPTLQNLYFLGVELFAGEDGLSGMARRMRRHLHLHWGINAWEMSLRIPESPLVFHYRCRNDALLLEETGPTDAADIIWPPGLDRFAFITSGNHWGQIRLAPTDARKTREPLALYFHFAAMMLDQYHRGHARQEKQARTLALLPAGVARLDASGQFVDANEAFLHLLQLPSVPQRMEVGSLLQHRFVTDIRQEWEAFIASGETRLSKIMHLRLASPEYPDGVALLVHRLPGGNPEFLMLLENAAHYASLQKNSARYGEFVSRIFAALPETIMVLDAAGTVIWASAPKGNALAGKNIFTLAKPATAFFQAPWDESFLAGLNQSTAMEARLQIDQTQGVLWELSFTPMPDSTSHAVLVVARDPAAVQRVDDKNRPQNFLDSLTGLASHSQLYLALEREIDHAQRLGKTVGFIFCDLEQFKRVNAMYGYQTGDSILRRAGAAIGAVARKGIDLAARFGGDDFAVVVNDASREMTANMAIKIRENVHAACKGAVDVNCGLILLPGGCSGPGHAVDAARRACARARTTPGRVAWAENREERDTQCSSV